jgi:hypothetical protein
MKSKLFGGLFAAVVLSACGSSEVMPEPHVLALSAGIEAARAGQQGQGFSEPGAQMPTTVMQSSQHCLRVSEQVRLLTH